MGRKQQSKPGVSQTEKKEEAEQATQTTNTACVSMYHSTHACQQAQGGGWGHKHTVSNSNTVTKQQETARACQRPHKSMHNLVNGQQSSQRPTQRRQKGGPCEGTPQHATCGSSRCELHSQYELQSELHAASRHRTVPLQATCVPHCAKKGPTVCNQAWLDWCAMQHTFGITERPQQEPAGLKVQKHTQLRHKGPTSQT